MANLHGETDNFPAGISSGEIEKEVVNEWPNLLCLLFYL